MSGIPAVKAFREGRVVAEFTGARSRPMVEAFLDELLAPPRADVLIEELRAAGELPDVVRALDADDLEGALAWIVEAVPAAPAAQRDRLREVAVALLDRLARDRPRGGLPAPARSRLVLGPRAACSLEHLRPGSRVGALGPDRRTHEVGPLGGPAGLPQAPSYDAYGAPTLRAGSICVPSCHSL